MSAYTRALLCLCKRLLPLIKKEKCCHMRYVRLYQWLPSRSKGPPEVVWSSLQGWIGRSNSARGNVRIPKENSSQPEDSDKVLLPHQAAVSILGTQLSISFLPQLPLTAGFHSGWRLFKQRSHPVTSSISDIPPARSGFTCLP